VGVVVFLTLIGPVVAAEGTVTLSSVEDTCVTADAEVLLNFTVELELNPMPVILTTVPPGPLAGLKPVIESVVTKLVALPPVPPAVMTQTLPAAAPDGTTAVSSSADMYVTVCEYCEPNLTAAPGTKFEPWIVTMVPVIPEPGENDATVGAP
jgi:hypothetical protein